MRLLLLTLAVLLLPPAFAQSPVLTRVDPPNWYAGLPAPMLLVQGEFLTGSNFTLSDPHLHLTHTVVSPNGHWAQLWLDRSPAAPETIQIRARKGAARAEAPYTFSARNPHTPAGFSSADVLYLIMPDRFADGDLSNDGPDGSSAASSPQAAAERAKPRGWHGGDLRGITEHLDYLQQLGVTAVWITPVVQNHQPQSYHGYGATDLYRLDEHFGTLTDLQQLGTALHARNMKLVLDIVPNHLGPAHPWVHDSPTPTWFHGTAEAHTLAQGEFKPLTDPHAPWRDQRNVTQGWFANVLPDLNQEDPAVAQYLTQNTIWWAEQVALDGLRIDTFPYVGRQFWHTFHAQLHSLYPHIISVGEIFNGDPAVTSSFAGGVSRSGAPDAGIDTGLDTPFDFPTFFALRKVFLQDAPMSALADVLRYDSLYPHPERLVPFFGNHDVARFLSEPGATPGRLELAFATLLTMRGMPEIYAGDEIGMQGVEDPDNRRDFPGGFPDPLSSAHNDAFNPQQRTPQQAEIHDFVQRLLALRQGNPALQTGYEQVLFSDANVLLFTRSAGSHTLLIAINKSLQTQSVTVPLDGTILERTQVFKALLGTPTVSLSNEILSLQLPAESASIGQTK